MATRAYIGVQCDDGIHAVYCHWDGYPEHAGRILKDHYSDFMKLCTLINHGDVSSIGPELGEKHSFDWFLDQKDLYEKNKDLWTTFYGRDRGEKDVDHRLYASEQSFLNGASGAYAEYAYLFDNGNWITYKI